MNSFDLYKILGIDKGSSADDIKAAYKKRCLLLHPDKNKSEYATQEFIKLQEAYKILSDPIKRAEYDGVTDVENNPLIEFMMNLLSVQFDLFMKKKAERKDLDTKLPPDLNFEIDASLDEIYRNATKIVKVNVLRDNVMTPISFGVNLSDMWEPSIFEKAGDNCLADVIFTIKPKVHPQISIDHTLNSYDLSMEIGISLYELYYGFQNEIDYLSGTKLEVSRNGGLDRDVNPMTMVMLGKGLPYDDGGKRGDLYIFFRLLLPKQIPQSSYDKAFLEEYFKREDEKERVDSIGFLNSSNT